MQCQQQEKAVFSATSMLSMHSHFPASCRPVLAVRLQPGQQNCSNLPGMTSLQRTGWIVAFGRCVASTCPVRAPCSLSVNCMRWCEHILASHPCRPGCCRGCGAQLSTSRSRYSTVSGSTWHSPSLCFLHCCCMRTCACLAAVLLLILGQYLPESPRYLLAQKDTAGAQAVLQRIAHINGKRLVFSGPAEAADGSQLQQSEAQHMHCIAGVEDERESLVGRETLTRPHQQLQDSSSGSSSTAAPHTAHKRHSSGSDGPDRQHNQQADHQQQQWQSKQQLHKQGLRPLDLEAAAADNSSSSGLSTGPRHNSPLPASQAQLSQQGSAPPAATKKTQPAASSSGGLSMPAHDYCTDAQHQDNGQHPARTPSLTPDQFSPLPTPATLSASPSLKSHLLRQQQQQWRGYVPPQLQQLLGEVNLAAKLLSQPPYSATTALLLFSWASTSFAYYGLVQLVGQLHLGGAGGGGTGGPVCTDGVLQVGQSC